MSSKNNFVDIKCGRLFPFHFHLVAVAFIAGGMGTITISPIFSIVLLLLAGLILTAYEGTEIDKDSRTYREYQSFLFLKRGARKKYDCIEKIYINAGKVSRKMYTAHTTHSSIFTDVEYSAYLKFGDGVRVFLMSSKNKDKLMNRVRHLGERLNTSVTDNTLHNSAV